MPVKRGKGVAQRGRTSDRTGPGRLTHAVDPRAILQRRPPPTVMDSFIAQRLHRIDRGGAAAAS